MKNIEQYRERLVSLREEIVEERRDGDEAAGTVVLDQTRVGRLSRMDALQAQAMSAEAQRRRKQHMQQVDAALRRIDEGDYGYCLDCGEEIAPARLDFDPAADLCIRCANRHEQ